MGCCRQHDFAGKVLCKLIFVKLNNFDAGLEGIVLFLRLRPVAGLILLFLGLARLSVVSEYYSLGLLISEVGSLNFTQTSSKEFISHRPPVLLNKARRAPEYSRVMDLVSGEYMNSLWHVQCNYISITKLRDVPTLVGCGGGRYTNLLL